MALVGHAVHDRLHAGVETGDIASSGQNADPHLIPSVRSWSCRLRHRDPVLGGFWRIRDQRVRMLVVPESPSSFRYLNSVT